MRFVPLGVRGSTPAPGADFVRFGGHTSCVAVLGDNHDVPRLVLDAGTGLRSLPTVLAGAPFRGDIILTHLHWDHVQGLPFTPAIDNAAAEVTLHVPVPTPATDPLELLAGAMAPPHFPIRPDGLHGQWRFNPADAGVIKVGEAVVTLARIDHKGGVTLGVRVDLDGASLAYLPDHAVTERAGQAAIRLAQDCDLLLHNGQFLVEESATAQAYGHATIEAALTFADDCRAGEVVLTHHAPARTDAQLAALESRYVSTPRGRRVRFAHQDESIRVCPQN